MTFFGTRPALFVVFALAAILLCIGASLALAGCAGELPNKNPQTTTSLSVSSSTAGGTGTTTASTGSSSSTSTTESQVYRLSDEVASTWVESVQKLVALLQGTPPIASIQAPVGQLKEQYVQKLVALGREITGLSGEDQQVVYDRVDDKLSSLGGETWFTSYKDLYDHYAAGTDDVSQDFAVQLSSFDTLTQYAFFEVLKANDPAEATRLGIE